MRKLIGPSIMILGGLVFLAMALICFIGCFTNPDLVNDGIVGAAIFAPIALGVILGGVSEFISQIKVYFRNPPGQNPRSALGPSGLPLGENLVP